MVYLKNKKNDMIHPAMVTGEYSEQLSKNWINLGEGSDWLLHRVQPAGRQH